MAKVVIKSKAKKIVRKYPVEIFAPKYLDEVKLGKSNVVDLNKFVGKKIKMNLMYVTGSLKNQNIVLKFEVTKVDSGKAETEVVVYEQIPYYLGRFVKKGSDLVIDSYESKTKDDKKVIIKPFIVTKSNITSSHQNSIRNTTRELIDKDLVSKTYEDFMSSVISGKFQLMLRNELKKIYPLKAFEFKKVELIN